MYGGYLHLRSLAFVIAPIPYAVVAITPNLFFMNMEQGQLQILHYLY